jgi:hypothetical protein
VQARAPVPRGQRPMRRRRRTRESSPRGELPLRGRESPGPAAPCYSRPRRGTCSMNRQNVRSRRLSTSSANGALPSCVNGQGFQDRGAHAEADRNAPSDRRLGDQVLSRLVDRRGAWLIRCGTDPLRGSRVRPKGSGRRGRVVGGVARHAAFRGRDRRGVSPSCSASRPPPECEVWARRCPTARASRSCPAGGRPGGRIPKRAASSW